MRTRERSAPPLHDDETTLDALQHALERAEFTVERIEEVLGTHELSARPAEIAVHLRRLDRDAFSILARLFLLGVPVADEEARSALAPVPVERLAAVRLVTTDGDRVRATVRLVPHGDYYLASDADGESGAATPPDHVPGVQAPSVTLAKLAVRRPCDAALDLGTGCGIQALLASRHSARVVATDVNPRALDFAAFNARLNGVGNVEFRRGAGFDPVESEQFDLIVANPPYVISPDSEYAYRDSGLPGDEICRRIVEAAPAQLSEGGFAHLLVSWAHDQDGDWAAPLRDWVVGSGCDAWLLHYKTEDPLTHASNWLRPLAEAGTARYEEALDRWLEYLGRLGIEAIGYGAVVLRRRSWVRNWIHLDRLPLDRLEGASDHTLRVFAAQDALGRLGDDAALLDERFSLTERHRLEQTLVCRSGGFHVEGQTLELAEGLAFHVGLDRYTAALLPHFDGVRSLREVLAIASARLELAETEREEFVPAALPAVRRLLELGFLAARRDAG